MKFIHNVVVKHIFMSQNSHYDLIVLASVDIYY